jgi:hypothetical protein
LAAGAHTEKLEFVRHCLEPVLTRYTIFQLCRKTLGQLHYFGAPRAYQMMMMPIISIAQEFEARPATSEIKPFYQAHFLQQMHRPVYRGQIAAFVGQLPANLLDGERTMITS